MATTDRYVESDHGDGHESSSRPPGVHVTDSPGADRTAAARHSAMSWGQRLKRVFKLDIETCRHCGAAVKVITCIEDPVDIKQILAHPTLCYVRQQTDHIGDY